MRQCLPQGSAAAFQRIVPRTLRSGDSNYSRGSRMGLGCGCARCSESSGFSALNLNVSEISDPAFFDNRLQIAADFAKSRVSIVAAQTFLIQLLRSCYGEVNR